MIVTALLDPDTRSRLTELRKTYFPSSINYLPAHVTLFHAAPIELAAKWELPAGPISVDFGDPIFFGKGFGVKVISPEFTLWRTQLLATGLDFTAQDLNLKQLHVTFQNKVTPHQAKSDFEIFRQSWQPFSSDILGIETWKYCGGPWEHMQTITFK